MIAALVDAIAPGLCPDAYYMKSENALENAIHAMTLAQNWLQVPMVRSTDICAHCYLYFSFSYPKSHTHSYLHLNSYHYHLCACIWSAVCAILINSYRKLYNYGLPCSFCKNKLEIMVVYCSSILIDILYCVAYVSSFVFR